MKPFLFIALFASLFADEQIFGQEVLWKRILPFESTGECISKTTEAGNFILGGLQSFPMIALYDNNGNNFWKRNLCNRCGANHIIFTKELENGKILSISSITDVFITDKTGLHVDTTFNLGIWPLKIGLVYKVLDFNNKLVILSNYSNDTLNNFIQTCLSIANFEIISQEIKNRSGLSFSLAISSDSSSIEIESDSSAITIRKLDPFNQVLWEKLISIEIFFIHDIIVTMDSRILILGKTDAKANSLLLALNDKGDSLWRKNYNSNQSFNRIKESQSNYLIMIGSDNSTLGSSGPLSTVNISKISAQGELVWEHLEFIEPGYNIGDDFLFDKDQNIVVVGTGGITDVIETSRAFLLKLSNPLVSTKNPYQDFPILFPNPCNNVLTIENKNNQVISKIELFNMDGKQIHTILSNDSKYQLNTSILTSGIYYCKVFTSQNQVVKKFCKL